MGINKGGIMSVEWVILIGYSPTILLIIGVISAFVLAVREERNES